MHLGSIKDEAMLNEVKGNLFEFLVGLKLAQIHDLESKFYKNLPADLLRMMRAYDRHLRLVSPWLLTKLPVLADSMANTINEQCDKITDILLIGKMTSNKKLNKYHEADLLIQQQGSEALPVSLKLSKHGSFMNTKSGGVSSFLKKYFICPDSTNLQYELCRSLDHHFELMAMDLHSLYDLNYDGSFCEWHAHHLPSLPGELKLEAKRIVHHYYYAVSKKLFNCLQKIQENCPDIFIKAIPPLIGLGDPRIVIAVTTHRNYHLEKSLLKRMGCLRVSDIRMHQHRDGVGHFEVELDNLILQIRVKPMNTFLQKSLKVNCSVKYL